MRQKELFIGLVIAIIFLIFYSIMWRKDRIADQEFYLDEFAGIVSDIQYFEGRRGFPDIKLDTNWIYLGISGEGIYNHLNINDSICKKKESYEISIYRLDTNNPGGYIKLK